MANANDIALITPIDSNKRSVDSFGVEHLRFFEDEAVRCIKSWRRNGGWLKDIKIYVLNASRAEIQDKTIDALKSLGALYIEDYQPETSSFSSSFLNEPFCGKYFECIKPCKETTTIKVDLDMQLLKPIPQELLEISQNKVVIGQYDEKASKDQRGVLFADSNFKLPFDTNFIIASKPSHFYEVYFDTCYNGDFLKTTEWQELEKRYGSYYIEEFAIDWIASRPEAGDLLYPVTNYQYGEGYPALSSYSDAEVQKILFLHEHIYAGNKFPHGYDVVKEHMEYLKRSRKG